MLLWFKFGWRNLWRNKRRTIIELLSIGGSVFLGITWNNLAVGSYDQMINSGVKMGSGHIGIYQQDYLAERKTEQLITGIDALTVQLDEIDGVAGVFPRLQVPGLVRSARESRATGLMGMDFSRELATNPMLAEKRILDGALPGPDNPKTALVGSVLATELDLEVGKKFVVMAQDADGEIASSLLRVAGIVQTNIRELDASAVIIDRETLGDIIGRPDTAHELAVLLENHTLIERTRPLVDEIIAGTPDIRSFHWEEAMKDLAVSVQLDHVGLQVMVAILYLIVGIGTINTILMSVMERAREFGVIRAIGVNRSGVRKIVITEAFVLSLTGVCIGIFLSFLLGLYTSSHGIDLSGMVDEQGIGGALFEPIMYSTWDIAGMVGMGIGMIIIALGASLYPAHYVLNIKPSEAMRIY